MADDSVQDCPRRIGDQPGRRPTYQPMILVAVAFALGIGIDAGLDVPARISIASTIIALLSWAWAYRSSRRRPAGDKTLIRSDLLGSCCLLIAMVALGSYWHHGRWNWFGVNDISRFAGKQPVPCAVEGRLINEPSVLAPSPTDPGMTYDAPRHRTRVALRLWKLKNGGDWIPVSGVMDIILHAPDADLRSGDRVRVFGRLVSIEKPTNPGQFDFQSYYRRQGKLASLHVDHAECFEIVRPSSFLTSRLVYQFRRRLDQFAWENLAENEAAFASAILLGNREQMSPQRRELFLKTGTVHLLAISGLHVGILAGSLLLFFRMGLMNRKACLWATILFVLGYAWLVEFRPPATRAAILISLFCLGRLWGESNFSFNLLAIAGLLVLLVNPRDLFGLGPQLSFLAVMTLIACKDWIFWPPSSDPLQRIIASTRPWHVRTIFWAGRQMRTAALVSGLIWLVAMPLVAHRFHLVAPVALVINPLLLIPIAMGLYGGLGVMLFGFWFPLAASWCGWVCQQNLAAVEGMISIAHAIPGGHCWTPGPGWLAVGIFYVGFGCFVVYPPTRLPRRWLAALGLAWLVFAWLLPQQFAGSLGANRPSMAVQVIDVGHGLSVLVELPDGRKLLYDAGSMGSPDTAGRTIAHALWERRIEHLDAIVLSHADIDHFNAVPQLVRRFSIGVVYVSPMMIQNESPALQTLTRVLSEQDIPLGILAAGDRLAAGNAAEIHVLNPPLSGPPDPEDDADNSNSLVLLIRFGTHRVLLPGDLEADGLDRLLASKPSDCTVVLAPHHGSLNSHPAAFANWCTPEVVVISGSSNRIRDDAIAQFQRSVPVVMRTDQTGAVRCEFSDSEFQIRRWDASQSGWQPVVME